MAVAAPDAGEVARVLSNLKGRKDAFHAAEYAYTYKSGDARLDELAYDLLERLSATPPSAVTTAAADEALDLRRTISNREGALKLLAKEIVELRAAVAAPLPKEVDELCQRLRAEQLDTPYDDCPAAASMIEQLCRNGFAMSAELSRRNP